MGAFDGILLRGLNELPDLPPSVTIIPSRGTPTSSKSVSLSSSSSSQSRSASSSSSASSSIISPTLISSTTTSSIEASSSSLTSPPVTRTTFVVESFSVFPPVGNASSNTTSFLQNRLASGFVFAISGIFGLIFIIFIATFFIRRRRDRRLNEEAVSFDPVIVGRVDLEKARQSSSLGHGSHDPKSLVYNQYSPPPLYYGGSQPPPGSYNPHTGAQFYVPPARHSSPPLSPLPMQQQHQPQQHPLSYISTLSSAEDTGPAYGEMRSTVGLGGGHVPEDIRRQYSINRTA